jgi:hypothetical protein
MTDRQCCDGLCEQGRSCPYREACTLDRLASAEARLFCGGGGSDGLRGHPRHVGADLAVGVVGMTAQPEALRLAHLNWMRISLTNRTLPPPNCSGCTHNAMRCWRR